MSQQTKVSDTAALRSKITKSSATIVLLALATAPLGYFIRMLLSRSLSVEMFGLFYAVIALFTAISTYNDLGFGFSVSYLLPKFKQDKQFTKLWNTFIYDLIIETGTAVLISLGIFFSVNWIATHYFHTSAAVPLLQLGIIFFIAHSITSAFRKFFVGMEQEKIYGSIDFIYYSIVLIGTAGLYFLTNASIITYFFFWSLGYVLTSLIVVFLFLKKYSQFLRIPTWDGDLFKHMVSYATPTLLSTSFGTIIRSTDVFFLTIFTGLTAVGGYSIVIPIVNIPQILLAPVRTSLFPLISGLYERSPEQVGQITEKILKVVPLIAFYFCFFIFLIPAPIIQTLFGSKWMELAAQPLRIISLSFIVNLTASFLGVVVSGLGLVKQRMYFSIFSSAMSIIIGLTLIRLFGLLGAAWGGAILFSFSLFIQLFLIRSKVTFKIPFVLYLKLLMFGAALLFIFTFFDLAIRGLFQIFLLGMTYSALMAIFVFTQKELRNDVILTFRQVVLRK